jgi:preprotein translocase subunit SecB
MVVIKFDGYEVNSISYERNPNFDAKHASNPIQFTPQFAITARINEATKKATLNMVSNHTPENFPFHVTVDFTGHFSYEQEEDTEEVGFDQFLKVNGSAIMFPYLRMLISQVTGMSNEFPPLILPTINISAFFEDQKKQVNKSKKFKN